MTAFRDMTRAELEEAVAADLREFLADLDAPLHTETARQEIARHLASFEAHFEFFSHPLTETEKAARVSAPMQLRAKTAWGHLEMVRQGYEEAPR